MSCLEYNKKAIQGRLNKGFTLLPSEKYNLISSVAKNDLNDFFELVQQYEARMSVYQDSEGIYTVKESSKDKLENELNISDDLERLFLIDNNKAFHTESEKHKIASTATVNAIRIRY